MPKRSHIAIIVRLNNRFMENAVFDQVQHCLLTGFSTKSTIKVGNLLEIP